MKVKPLIVSGGLVTGHSDHLLKLHQAYVDYGFIESNEKINFAIHTWDIGFNQKYIKSLKRYEHKFNFNIHIESYEDVFLPMVGSIIHPADVQGGHWKTFLLTYSLWRAFEKVYDIEDYGHILKYKMDVISDHLPWGIVDNVADYFKRRSIHSFPALYNYDFTDCFYSQHIHDGIDERHFVTFPKPIKKIFLKKKLVDLMLELKEICLYLCRKYDIDPERETPWRVQGSTMWGELLKRNNIPNISVYNMYNGRSRGEITPKFVVDYIDNSYIIRNKDNYKYTPWNKLM